MSARELRIENLLGRRVLAGNNRSVGRIEECRAEHTGRDYTISGYVIGPAGLMERLGLGATLLLGRKRGGYFVRWDQIDISDPERPRLTCPVSDLRPL